MHLRTQKLDNFYIFHGVSIGENFIGLPLLAYQSTNQSIKRVLVKTLKFGKMVT